MSNIPVPTILSPNPITIPAEPEKTYPDLWIRNFSITVPNLSTGYVRLELLPYNASVPEILQTGLTNSNAIQIVQLPLTDALTAIPVVQTIFDLLYNSLTAFPL